MCLQVNNKQVVDIVGELVFFQGRNIEEWLSQIGAQIAKATEYSERAANLCVDSQSILIQAQGELSELYISLEELLRHEHCAPE